MLDGYVSSIQPAKRSCGCFKLESFLCGVLVMNGLLVVITALVLAGVIPLGGTAVERLFYPEIYVFLFFTGIIIVIAGIGAIYYRNLESAGLFYRLFGLNVAVDFCFQLAQIINLWAVVSSAPDVMDVTSKTIAKMFAKMIEVYGLYIAYSYYLRLKRSYDDLDQGLLSSSSEEDE